MDYAIIGAGSVGKIISAALSFNDKPNLFITRQCPESCCHEHVPYKLVSRTPAACDFLWRSPCINVRDFEKDEIKMPETVFVAVRAHQLDDALESLRPHLHDIKTLVFIQGGLQPVLAADARFIDAQLQKFADPTNAVRKLGMVDGSGPDIVSGLVSFGGQSAGRDLVHLNGFGKLVLGYVDRRTDGQGLEKIVGALQSPWFEASATQTVTDAMVQKACGTLALNAASLLWHNKVGMLVRNPRSFDFMCEVAAETAEAFRGIGFACMDNYGDYFRAMALKIPHHSMSILHAPDEIYASMIAPVACVRALTGVTPEWVEAVPTMRQGLFSPDRGNSQYARQAAGA